MALGEGTLGLWGLWHFGIWGGLQYPGVGGLPWHLGKGFSIWGGLSMGILHVEGSLGIWGRGLGVQVSSEPAGPGAGMGRSRG